MQKCIDEGFVTVEPKDAVIEGASIQDAKDTSKKIKKQCNSQSRKKILTNITNAQLQDQSKELSCGQSGPLKRCTTSKTLHSIQS